MDSQIVRTANFTDRCIHMTGCMECVNTGGLGAQLCNNDNCIYVEDAEGAPEGCFCWQCSTNCPVSTPSFLSTLAQHAVQKAILWTDLPYIRAITMLREKQIARLLEWCLYAIDDSGFGIAGLWWICGCPNLVCGVTRLVSSFRYWEYSL